MAAALLSIRSINKNVFISVSGTETAGINIQTHRPATTVKIVIVSRAHQVPTNHTPEVEVRVSRPTALRAGC